MTFEQIIGLGGALFLMAIGLLGCLLPVVPAVPWVLLVAIAHRLWFGAASVSNFVLGVLTGLTLLTLLLDFLASVIGAKKLGASWLGALGAVVGALAGLFFSLPGVILGPFLGALLFEMLGGRTFEQSTRAGLGAFLGLVFGALGKLVCCLIMMALFAVNVYQRSTPATNGVVSKPPAWVHRARTSRNSSWRQRPRSGRSKNSATIEAATLDWTSGISQFLWLEFTQCANKPAI